MPDGALINAAMPTISSVPRMALPKPPPSSNAAGGSEVNSDRLIEWQPFTTSM